MGKRTGKRLYGGRGKVWVLIHGFDDLRGGAKATDAKNVEAMPGIQERSVLHCAVVLRASELPPAVPAHVKIKLKSKYLCHKIRTVTEYDGEMFRDYDESFFVEEKWFEHSVLITAHPEPGTRVVDHTGYYRVDYLVTWQVPPDICASMDMVRKDIFNAKKAFWVYYTLRAKLFYDAYPVAYKGEKRAVEILTKVPEPDGISGRLRRVAKYKVNVEAQPDQRLLYEGGILSVTATIHNKSDETIKAGKLDVIENIDYDALHIERGPQRVEFKSVICAAELLELDIGPKKSVVRSFAVRLPSKVITSYTRLRNGIHRMLFDHVATLRLNGFGYVEMSIVIASRNVQAVHSPPISPPQPSAPLPPPSSPPTGDGRRAFVVSVKAAYDLPMKRILKVNADPFLRILVNDRHYRCTRIVKNNLNPAWGDEFEIYLTEAEQQKPPRLEVCCFDYKFLRKNKVIGTVQDGIDAIHENSGQFRMYELTDEKKSATRNRGSVELRYSWT